ALFVLSARVCTCAGQAFPNGCYAPNWQWHAGRITRTILTHRRCSVPTIGTSTRRGALPPNTVGPCAGDVTSLCGWGQRLRSQQSLAPGVSKPGTLKVPTVDLWRLHGGFKVRFVLAII